MAETPFSTECLWLWGLFCIYFLWGSGVEDLLEDSLLRIGNIPVSVSIPGWPKCLSVLWKIYLQWFPSYRQKCQDGKLCFSCRKDGQVSLWRRIFPSSDQSCGRSKNIRVDPPVGLDMAGFVTDHSRSLTPTGLNSFRNSHFICDSKFLNHTIFLTFSESLLKGYLIYDFIVKIYITTSFYDIQYFWNGQINMSKITPTIFLNFKKNMYIYIANIRQRWPVTGPVMN